MDRVDGCCRGLEGPRDGVRGVSRATVTWVAAIGCVALGIMAAPFEVAAQGGAYLGDLSWVEAERRIAEAPFVVIPFGGGAKEHGPHLPMNADAVVMEYLARQVVDSTAGLVAPAVYHGWFPAFRAFPGTEIQDPDVFRSYMFEIGRSLARQGAQRLVFLNTGISTATGLPISIAARELRVQFGVPVLVVSWDDLETPEIEALAEQAMGGHGGEIETSIHLYLQPDLVRMELAERDYRGGGARAYPGYEPGLFARDPEDPAYSTTGLFGDPTLATAEKGRAALAILSREWLRALRGFAESPRPG